MQRKHRMLLPLILPQGWLRPLLYTDGTDQAADLRAEFVRRQALSPCGQQDTSSYYAKRLAALERAVADTVFVDTDVAVLVAHRLLYDPELESAMEG